MYEIHYTDDCVRAKPALTQPDVCLRHMVLIGSLDSWESGRPYSIKDITDPVSKLRKLGVPIVTERMQVKTPYGYATKCIYSLPDDYRKIHRREWVEQENNN